jgi:hypothetical protein
LTRWTCSAASGPWGESTVSWHGWRRRRPEHV